MLLDLQMSQYLLLFIIYSLFYSLLLSLAFPADIGKEPASRAHGSRQRVHTSARTGFAGDAYTLANETVHGTTWRRPYGA